MFISMAIWVAIIRTVAALALVLAVLDARLLGPGRRGKLLAYVDIF
jgi:hypothetical protein